MDDTSAGAELRGAVRYERGDAPGRPPVFLGCAAVLLVLVLLIAGGACAIVFFESGAESGVVQLEDADAYAPGSVEFLSERNVFLVRTRDGAFFALLDLDGANRAHQGRRCRVALVPGADPALTEIMSRHQLAFSRQAAGLPIVFREDCNGATYDATGVRLDLQGGRNLDRYKVEVAKSGRVEISTGARVCSARSPHGWFDKVDC